MEYFLIKKHRKPMPKKEATLEQIYPLVDKLSTQNQVKLQGYLERTLEQKAKTASEELSLINGNNIQSN